MQTSDDQEVSARMEEGVPLLPKYTSSKDEKPTAPAEEGGAERRRSMREKVEDSAKSAISYGTSATDIGTVFGTSHNNKMLCYDQNALLNAKAMLFIGKSAFAQKPVLYTLLYCSTLALVSALCVFFIPKASKLDTAKFERFSSFLKFFIVFMLGIYVSQGFKRWWFTVTSFEKFLIAIRQMVFMLHTIRVTPASRKLIETYCVASGYILNIEVRNAQIVESKDHVDMLHLERWLVAKGFLTEEEMHQLGQGAGSPLSCTRAIWAWIGELISHPVVEEGVAVLPPLLVRTIVLCQACVSEVENLKMNITMQTPFMYSQLLAILVHVNNTILAICCGMTIGSSMNEIRRRSEQLEGVRDTERSEVTVTEQFYGAIQTTGLQLITVLLTPMLYVAFLHIAHMLCYPFGDESYHLPTETLIARLHSELKAMDVNRAYFRQRHKEWLVMEKKGKGGALDDKKDEDGDDADCGCD